MAAPGTPQPDAPAAQPAEAWAAWLAKALRAKSLNDNQFARLSGIKTTTVNRWTSGESPPRSADTVIAVAHLLAPDQTAEALDAAGFPRTAQIVRQGRVPDTDDAVPDRARREYESGRITREDMERIVSNFQRRRDENARLFEAEVADLLRERRRERRARYADDDDDPKEGNREAL